MSHDLYHPIILERNKEPKHYGKTEKGEKIIAYNPVCGDEFEIRLIIENHIITNVHFSGYGCAVSKASIDMLLSSILNQSLVNAEKEIRRYLDQLEKEDIEGDLDEYPLGVFRAVRKYPARRDCATLGANSLYSYFK